MKRKIRKSGKGRVRRFAHETLVEMTKGDPSLWQAYELWSRLREQDEKGSGQVLAGEAERPLLDSGEGVFWQVSWQGELVLFLFSPQRAVRVLRGREA